MRQILQHFMTSIMKYDDILVYNRNNLKIIFVTIVQRGTYYFSITFVRYLNAKTTHYNPH